MAVAPFPFETLPRLSLADAALGNAAVAWLGAVVRPALGMQLRALGLEVSAWRLAAVTRRSLDSSTGLAWLTRDGERALLSLPGELVRAQAARLLAGPMELSAPRALTAAEHAVAAMLCASALAGVSGVFPGAGKAEVRASGVLVEPWQPFPDVRSALAAAEQRIAGWPCLEVAVQLERGGGVSLDGREHLLRLWLPASLIHRRPLRRAPAPWLGQSSLALALIAATAPITAGSLAHLRARDIIIVESAWELRVGRGSIAVRCEGGDRFGAEADRLIVESGYRRRVPSANAPLSPSPDDALEDVTSELTVTLGAVSLSLRQLSELSVGQVISLQRPLAGPFEIHVGGKPIGRGELVDVEGSLGVRVVTLEPGP